MATCENFKITLRNETNAEIKATKFEYKDGSNWKTENIFFGDGGGAAGSQKIEKDQEVPFTGRRLGGIGNEDTMFRVSYSHHIGGTNWGPTIVETTETFRAQDNGKKTVTLTK